MAGADTQMVLEILAKMNLDNAMQGIKTIQKSANDVVIGGKNGIQVNTKTINKTGNEIQELYARINQKAANGFKTEGDATAFAKDIDTMQMKLQQFYNEAQTLGAQNTVDLGKIFKFEQTTEITGFKQQIDQIKSSVKSFFEIDNTGASGQTLNKELEGVLAAIGKAGDSTNIKKLAKDFKELQTAMKAGDLTKVQDLTQKLQSSNLGKPATSGVKEATTFLNNLQNAINGVQSKNLTDLQQAISGLNAAQLAQLQEWLTKVKGGLDGINNGIGGVKNFGPAVKDGSSQMASLNQELQSMSGRVSSFFQLANGARLLKQALRSTLSTVKEIDAAMVKTAVVSEETTSTMWDKLPQYTAQAKKLGSTITDVIEAQTLYVQQGLDTDTSMDLAEQSMKMARVAGITAEQATEGMTSALRGFNMDLTEASATHINDVYSNLAKNTASDTSDLITGMEKVASIAYSANMDFETTAAFIAQIKETTQESATTAGTALKTIIARFSEVKKLYSEGQLTGTDEEGSSIEVNKISQALKTAGIDLNKYFLGEVGLDDIFTELASKWDGLTGVQQRYLATQAAGSRQQSRFIAMMQDYNRTLELQDIAYNSAGAGEEQFAKTQDSMESKLNSLKDSWQEFLMGLFNSDLVKGGIDVLTKLLEKINSIIDALSGGGKTGKTLVSGGLLGALFMGGKAVLGQGGVLPQFIATLFGGLSTNGTEALAGAAGAAGGQAQKKLGKGLSGTIATMINNAFNKEQQQKSNQNNIQQQNWFKRFGSYRNNLKNSKMFDKDKWIDRYKSDTQNRIVAMRTVYDDQFGEGAYDEDRKNRVNIRRKYEATGKSAKDALNRQLNLDAESNAATAEQANNEALAGSLSAVGQAAQMAGGLILTLTSAIDDSTSTGRAWKAGLTVLGTALIFVGTCGTIMGTLISAGGKMATAAISAIPIVGLIAGLATLIAIVIAVMVELGSFESKAQRASARLGSAIEATDNAINTLQSGIEETSSLWDELGSKTAVLEGLTAGTSEFSNAVASANDTALALINTMEALGQPLDFTIDQNGLININEEDYNSAQTALNDNLDLAKKQKTELELAKAQTDAEAAKIKLNRLYIRSNSFTSKEFEEYYGAGIGAMVASGADPIVGTATLATATVAGIETGVKAIAAWFTHDDNDYLTELAQNGQINRIVLQQLQLQLQDSTNSEDKEKLSVVNRLLKMSDSRLEVLNEQAQIIQKAYAMENSAEAMTAKQHAAEFSANTTNKYLSGFLQNIAYESYEESNPYDENGNLIYNGKTYNLEDDVAISELVSIYAAEHGYQSVAGGWESSALKASGVDQGTIRNEDMVSLAINEAKLQQHTEKLQNASEQFLKMSEISQKAVSGETLTLAEYRQFSTDIASNFKDYGWNREQEKEWRQNKFLEAKSQIINIEALLGKELLTDPYTDGSMADAFQNLSVESLSAYNNLAATAIKSGSNFLKTIITNATNGQLQNGSEATIESLSKQADIINAWNLGNNVDLLIQLNKQAKQKGQAGDLASNALTAFQHEGRFSTSSILKDFMSSGLYANISDSISETITKNGSLTADDIDELVTKYSDLQDIIDTTKLSNDALAKSIQGLVTGTLNIEGLTDAVAAAAGEYAGWGEIFTKVQNIIKDYNPDTTLSDIQDYQDKVKDTIDKTSTSYEYYSAIDSYLGSSVETGKYSDKAEYYTEYQRREKLATTNVRDLLVQALTTDGTEYSLNNDKNLKEVLGENSWLTYDNGVLGWDFSKTNPADMLQDLTTVFGKNIASLMVGWIEAKDKYAYGAMKEREDVDAAAAAYREKGGILTKIDSTGKYTVDNNATQWWDAAEIANLARLASYGDDITAYLQMLRDNGIDISDDSIKYLRDSTGKINLDLVEKAFPTLTRQSIIQSGHISQNGYGWAYNYEQSVQNEMNKTGMGRADAEEAITQQFKRMAEAGEQFEVWYDDTGKTVQSSKDIAAGLSLQESLIQNNTTEMGTLSDAISTLSQTIANGLEIKLKISAPSGSNDGSEDDENGTIIRVTAESAGGIVSSYANGSSDRKIKPGLALTGELGPEIVWNGEKGYSYLTGINGPNYAKLKPGDHIFNAEETQDILNNSGALKYGAFALGGKVGSYGNEADPRGKDTDEGSGTGKGGTKVKVDVNVEFRFDEDKQIKDSLGKMYNTLQDIDELQFVQKRLQEEYNQLLKKQNVSAKELWVNLKKQKSAMAEESTKQQAMYDYAKKSLQTTLATEYKEFSKYAHWNETDETVEIDWDAIAKLRADKKKNEKDVKAIEEFVKAMETQQKTLDDARNKIDEIEKNQQELIEAYRDATIDWKNTVKEAIVNSLQKQIDNSQSISDSIDNANSKLLDSINKSLEKQRQERENQKTEKDLSDTERRLAYLRQDSSNANALEIAQLEKELQESREDYTDTLIDQRISDLEEQNNEASEQRKEQIELMTSSLQWLQDTGRIWEDYTKLMSGAYYSGTILSQDTKLFDLLKDAAGFLAMSEEERSKWEQEMSAQAAQAEVYNSEQNQLETKGIKKGTSITFTDADGEEYTGTVDKDGNVVVTMGSAKATFKDVYERADGTYNTLESADSTRGNGVTWTNTAAFKSDDSGGGGSKKGSGNLKYFDYVEGNRIMRAWVDEQGNVVQVTVGKDSGKWNGDNKNDYNSQANKFNTNTGLSVPTAKTKEISASEDQVKGGSYGTTATVKKIEAKNGGLFDTTGLMQIDGTASAPELVLNAQDTKNFLQLKEVLSSLTSSGNAFAESNGDNYYEINLNVDQIANDYDVDKLATRIKKIIYEDSMYRNVNTINRLR